MTEPTNASQYQVFNRKKTIFRIVKNKSNPYVMIDKRPIENPLLSWKAKGILAYLLSRPDGWEVNVPDLVSHSTDGAAAVRTGLKELSAAGHVHYNVEREGGYIKKWIVEIYEIPDMLIHIEEGYKGGQEALDADFQQVENQQVENRGEVIIDLKQYIVDDVDAGVEISRKTAILAKLHTENFGVLTPLLADLIRNAAIDTPETWYEPAFKIALENGVRKFSYVEAIWNGWRTNGFGSKPEFIKKYEKKNGNGKRPNQEAGEQFMKELAAKRARLQAEATA